MGKRYRHRLKGEGHDAFRSMLRVVGPLLILVGGGMFVAGVVSFSSHFDDFPRFPGVFGGSATEVQERKPDRFWMCFVGVPLAVLGIGATRFGYLGAASRYVASEVAPVARDTVNYMVDGTRESLRTVGAALRGEAEPAGGIRCPECDTENDAQARFCDHCGADLAPVVACGRCGAENDRDANYCDDCGHPLRDS